MMDITKQNSDDNIRLLAAQRHLYTKAKNMHKWRSIAAIILAIISPVIIFFIPGINYIMIVIGVICIFIMNSLKDIESNVIKEAATIQEQFDTDLFGLNWNRTIVGNKVGPEIISEADRDFNGDRNELKNWYADTGKSPYPINVLLCQRSNLVWDWRLHWQYGYLLVFISIGWAIILIVFGIIAKQANEYMVGLFIPSLPALLQGAESAMSHFRICREKEMKEKEISQILDAGFVTIDQCREFQDYIYINRKEPFVPDWWYKIFRNKYEYDMRFATKDFSKKYD